MKINYHDSYIKFNFHFLLLQYQLQKASLAENDAFAFLRAENNGNYITYSAFCDALRQVLIILLEIISLMGLVKFSPFLNHLQVNLTGISHGLSFQETKDLWVQADTDGNGVLDYEEFKVCCCIPNLCLNCQLLSFY